MLTFNFKKYFSLVFLMFFVSFLGCQTTNNEITLYRGLGESESFSTTPDQAFQKAKRALELSGVMINRINPEEGAIQGRFGGSRLLWEPQTNVYVYIHPLSDGMVSVEFYARGSYSEKFEKVFFKSFRRIIAGNSEY